MCIYIYTYNLHNMSLGISEASIMRFFLPSGVKVDSKLLNGWRPIILFQDFLCIFGLLLKIRRRLNESEKTGKCPLNLQTWGSGETDWLHYTLAIWFTVQFMQPGNRLRLNSLWMDEKKFTKKLPTWNGSLKQHLCESNSLGWSCIHRY